MTIIDDIIQAIHGNRIRVTDHADEEAENDNLKFDEVRFSALNGEIIENYPKDKPYPSCLVCGQSPQGYPIHSVWGYNRSSKWAVLITVYRPDPARWTDEWRKRKTD